MKLNSYQTKLNKESSYDFSGLKAIFINCTLKKSPALLIESYEADSDFDKFQHCPSYDSMSSEARSYPFNKKNQEVSIGSLQQSFLVNHFT